MMASGMLHAACTIPPSFWDWPRSANAVLSMKEIRPCIDAYLADPESKLLIHHGAGVDGTLHAGELHAWLISLAISPSRIHDASDLPGGMSMENLDH